LLEAIALPHLWCTSRHAAMEEPLLRQTTPKDWEKEQQLLPKVGRADTWASLCFNLVALIFSPVPLRGMLVTTIATRMACFRLPSYVPDESKLVFRSICLVMYTNFVGVIGMVCLCIRIWQSQLLEQHQHVIATLDQTVNVKIIVGGFPILLGLTFFRGAMRWVMRGVIDRRIMELSAKIQEEILLDVTFAVSMLAGPLLIVSVMRAGGFEALEQCGWSWLERSAARGISCVYVMGAFAGSAIMFTWLRSAEQVYRDLFAHATIYSLATMKQEHPFAHEPCPICLTSHAEDMEGLGSCTTPCGHSFHRGCFASWLNFRETLDPVCPCCRANLISENAEQGILAGMLWVDSG